MTGRLMTQNTTINNLEAYREKETRTAQNKSWDAELWVIFLHINVCENQTNYCRPNLSIKKKMKLAVSHNTTISSDHTMITSIANKDHH